MAFYNLEVGSMPDCCTVLVNAVICQLGIFASALNPALRRSVNSVLGMYLGFGTWSSFEGEWLVLVHQSDNAVHIVGRNTHSFITNCCLIVGTY